MAIFFTSDTHFGHENIITYCDRPFKSFLEMDEALIKAWNLVVKPEDEVYHLGDVFFGNLTYAGEVLDRLNGVKTLIRGNHDYKTGFLKEFFAEVVKEKTLNLPEGTFYLKHKPQETWDTEFHLHGHTHGTLENFPVNNRMDVGVDCSSTYAPFSLTEVLELLGERHVLHENT